VDKEISTSDFGWSGAPSPKEGGVALCFKVPFRFRQWLKLQALSRNLTMTEFLMKAAKWYSEANTEGSARGAPHTDLQK
jgi:hypothetical protein